MITGCVWCGISLSGSISRRLIACGGFVRHGRRTRSCWPSNRSRRVSRPRVRPARRGRRRRQTTSLRLKSRPAMKQRTAAAASCERWLRQARRHRNAGAERRQGLRAGAEAARCRPRSSCSARRRWPCRGRAAHANWPSIIRHDVTSWRGATTFAFIRNPRRPQHLSAAAGEAPDQRSAPGTSTAEQLSKVRTDSSRLPTKRASAQQKHRWVTASRLIFNLWARRKT